jgi:hypothetical protein
MPVAAMCQDISLPLKTRIPRAADITHHTREGFCRLGQGSVVALLCARIVTIIYLTYALSDHKNDESNAMAVSQDTFPARSNLPVVMWLASLRAIVLASVPVIAPACLTQAGRVQLPGLTVPASATADRASVVRIFKESYNAYRCAQEISWVLFPCLI